MRTWDIIYLTSSDYPKVTSVEWYKDDGTNQSLKLFYRVQFHFLERLNNNVQSFNPTVPATFIEFDQLRWLFVHTRYNIYQRKTQRTIQWGWSLDWYNIAHPSYQSTAFYQTRFYPKFGTLIVYYWPKSITGAESTQKKNISII